jgi:hypothetical protein
MELEDMRLTSTCNTEEEAWAAFEALPRKDRI